MVRETRDTSRHTSCRVVTGTCERCGCRTEGLPHARVLRKLQLTYRMEPAGSQGVWGLDDFQFVPYIWGSLQLAQTSGIPPEHIPLREKAEQYHADYLFFDCVRFIHTVKSGQFAEHSNVLWGISAVPRWEKVNSGLIKMYKAEVLAK